MAGGKNVWKLRRCKVAVIVVVVTTRTQYFVVSWLKDRKAAKVMEINAAGCQCDPVFEAMLSKSKTIVKMKQARKIHG